MTWNMISRSRELSVSKRSLSAPQGLITLPTGTIAREAGLDGVEHCGAVGMTIRGERAFGRG